LKKITEQYRKTNPEASEGWETNKSLSKELKIAKSSLKKITEQYRKTNPEYFEDRRHKDIGGIYEHYSPVFVDILRNKFDKGIDGKENWKSIRQLAKDLETDYGVVARIAEQYRKTNPEYFEKLQDNEVGLRKHISPELVKIIQEKITESKNTPSNRLGWETNTALAEELNVSFNTISNLANQYRKTNPEYFEISKDKMGNIREYYSTELVKIIQEKIREFKEVPMIKDGWKANRVLAEELGIHENTLKKIANQYRKANPQYFEYQKRKSGGMFESYSPELVEILNGEIEKFKEVPEDYLLWSTNKALAKELEINEPFLAKLVSPYRETNPEYFKDFRNTGKRGGRIHEHYSPELINIIKEEINKENLKIPVVPENWQSAADISERVGLSKEEVEKIAKKLRANYPEGYGKFKKSDE
jgi:plasmid maintenance system antidote protein VapI